MGGIQQRGSWTSFGGTDFAPTVPIHVPAGIAFFAGIKTHVPTGPIAIILLLAGSVTAVWCVVSFGTALFWRDRPIMGRYYWRVLGILLGWGWILVPAKMSWIYQWTVAY